MTISAALRGTGRMAEGTRKRVINLASRMGYQPSGNALQRYGAATEKLVSIGVMVCWSEEIKRNPNMVAYHMLAGISEGTMKMHNISIATYFVPPEFCQQISDPQNQLPALRSGVLSGLVLIYNWPRETVRYLSSLLPCVSIIESHLDLDVDCIGDSQFMDIGMMVKHLYRLGHRQIGFLSSRNGGPWLFPRHAGYLQAMRRVGLPLDPSSAVNVYEVGMDENAQADAVVECLRRGVTAWVCAGDCIGYELYRRLTERGLRIPQDVSITGFDGITPPQGYPQLTTVRQPFEKMGAGAVRQLLRRIESPTEPVCGIQFGCEFIEGETTGPPPDKQ